MDGDVELLIDSNLEAHAARGSLQTNQGCRGMTTGRKAVDAEG